MLANLLHSKTSENMENIFYKIRSCKVTYLLPKNI